MVMRYDTIRYRLLVSYVFGLNAIGINVFIWIGVDFFLF